MFGYQSKDEFMAVSVSDLYQNPEDRSKFKETISKYGSVNKYEVNLKKKDGTFFVGSVSAVAVKDANGDVKYYDGIIEDITGKREIELQLQQAQKLEAIGIQVFNFSSNSNRGKGIPAKCQRINALRNRTDSFC